MAPIQPELVVLGGAGFWLAASLATGLPHGRFPSEFPALFTYFSFIGALIGLSESVPEDIDILFTVSAVILFAIGPVIFTVYLFKKYPPRGDGNHVEEARTLTNGG